MKSSDIHQESHADAGSQDQANRRAKHVHAKSSISQADRPRSKTIDDGPSDANPLCVEMPRHPSRPMPWQWIGAFIFVILSISMLATVLVTTAARDKKQTILRAEERRLQVSVDGRTKVLRTWLDSQHAASRRLSESEVFRLFISDLADQNTLAPLPRSLQDQRPYFRKLIRDFAQQNRMSRATIIREDGTILLSNSGPPLSISEILDHLKQAPAEWHMLPLPIRALDDEETVFVIDLLIPLPPVQHEGQAKDMKTTFLILTWPAEAIAVELLSDRIDAINEDQVALLQRAGGQIEHFVLENGILEKKSEPLPERIDPNLPLDFARYGQDASVYAAGVPLTGSPWMIYHAVDARMLMAPVQNFIFAAITLAILIVLTLASTFFAAWWRKDRDHYQQLVKIHRTQSGNLEQQQRFLQAITRSIGDWITVSDKDDHLIYANPAFIAACSTSEKAVLGKRWQDVVAETPYVDELPSNLHDLMDSMPLTRISSGMDRHIVSIKTFALKNETAKPDGVIRVLRDHTTAANERRSRVEAIAQTIDAFVHAVERRDSFLVGHTHRVRSHAIAIGRKLELSNEDLATVAVAASLSQIGKIFVPDEILTKPSRHNEQEVEIMRGHIHHAIEILKSINFELPITDVLVQMYERLDGSGYPYGLTGEQIGLPARILGVADVYCARTAPRSYRDRLSAEETLYHLSNNAHRYDPKVTLALTAIVGNEPAKFENTDIEQMFIDANTWRRVSRSTMPNYALG
jgi:HD-GYP domain-containing protein (c-di-GMP phosphodiesterase class II)